MISILGACAGRARDKGEEEEGCVQDVSPIKPLTTSTAFLEFKVK